MKCAYCGKEAKGTKEHIISSGILGLFPECFMTIDGDRGKMYPSDPMVKDVCSDCNNNKISYIDSYAKQLIQQYFIVKYKKDDKLDFDYDYVLIQKMCLKYAFNDMRARKLDYSFFDSDIINYLLDEQRTSPLRNVTIMAGLAVNTSPAPDFIFGNNKLRWGNNPIFLSNSIIENIDYNTGKITIRENNPPEKFECLSVSYIFRFNSAQILLLCWDKNISEEQLNRNQVVLKYQYPYSILNVSGHSILERCTSESTYHHEKLIDVTWGQGLSDEMSYMRGTFSEQAQAHLKEVEKEWQGEERRLAEEHPRK